LLPRQLLRLRVEVCWPPFPLPQVAETERAAKQLLRLVLVR